MKYAGIGLLCVGVAISAAYGARLSPSMRAQMIVRGEAQFMAGATGAAKGAYCAAVIARLDGDEAMARRLAERDGCELPSPGDSADGAAESSEVDVGLICAGRASTGESFEAVVGGARAELAERTEFDMSGVDVDLTGLRAAWIEALRAEVEPAARAAVLERVPPARRVTEWLADSGPVFGLGLLLVVFGAVLGRIASRREASREPTGEDGAPARDFGELLEELRAEVATMAELAASKEDPSQADHDALKAQITDLQAEKLEPIVESGPRLQAKYGMASFADVFGPLASGERLMNRAWSALVDSHWPEAANALERSTASLEQACEALERASGNSDA